MPGPTALLLGLLVLLMGSGIFYTRESLLFCEKALLSEMQTIAKEDTANKPIRFNEVCPEMRARAEGLNNKFLEVLLALLVQFNHPRP